MVLIILSLFLFLRRHHFVLTPMVWFRDSVQVWKLSLFGFDAVLADSVASNTLLTTATLLVSKR
jgi:hypothetical protein